MSARWFGDCTALDVEWVITSIDEVKACSLFSMANPLYFINFFPALLVSVRTYYRISRVLPRHLVRRSLRAQLLVLVRKTDPA